VTLGERQRWNETGYEWEVRSSESEESRMTTIVGNSCREKCRTHVFEIGVVIVCSFQRGGRLEKGGRPEVKWEG